MRGTTDMTLSLVLTDDWELRGDGSGDMYRLQFDTMRRLNSIYEDHGIRGSYNAEVMQQLNHIRLGEKHPELKRLAQDWEAIVLETHQRGHDVQLHVHSQWSRASYENGRWSLAGDWAITSYPRAEMAHMIAESRCYLESLLRRVDPQYQCISYRAGAWAIAPNEHILSVLAEQGIVFDMSICGGIKYDNAVMKLDYTHCEETFLPYYPAASDARRKGSDDIGIACVPTFSFRPSRASVLKRDVNLVQARARRWLSKSRTSKARPGRTQDYEVWRETAKGGGTVASIRNKLKNRVQPVVEIADLSVLSFDFMKDMIASMRRVARDRNVESTAVILENHTKNISNFDDIKRFADYVTRQPDLEVITLREVARRLKSGAYSVLRSKYQAFVVYLEVTFGSSLSELAALAGI